MHLSVYALSTACSQLQGLRTDLFKQKEVGAKMEADVTRERDRVTDLEER